MYKLMVVPLLFLHFMGVPRLLRTLYRGTRKEMSFWQLSGHEPISTGGFARSAGLTTLGRQRNLLKSDLPCESQPASVTQYIESLTLSVCDCGVDPDQDRWFLQAEEETSSRVGLPFSDKSSTYLICVDLGRKVSPSRR